MNRVRLGDVLGSMGFVRRVDHCRMTAIGRRHLGFAHVGVHRYACSVTVRVAPPAGPVIRSAYIYRAPPSRWMAAIAAAGVRRISTVASWEVWKIDVVSFFWWWLGHPHIDAAEEVGPADNGRDKLCGRVEVVYAADVIPRDDELNGHDDDSCDEEIRDCAKLLQRLDSAFCDSERVL